MNIEKSCHNFELCNETLETIKKDFNLPGLIKSPLTQEYLDKNGLLYKYPSGFHANFSTDLCLVKLPDFILGGMNKGFHTGLILVDLQEAFYT